MSTQFNDGKEKVKFKVIPLLDIIDLNKFGTFKDKAVKTHSFLSGSRLKLDRPIVKIYVPKSKRSKNH